MLQLTQKVNMFAFTVDRNQFLVEGRFYTLVDFEVYIVRLIRHLQPQHYLATLHKPEFADFACRHTVSLVFHSIQNFF